MLKFEIKHNFFKKNLFSKRRVLFILLGFLALLIVLFLITLFLRFNKKNETAKESTLTKVQTEDKEEKSVIIEENDEIFSFSVNIDYEVFVPEESFSNPPFLTGPWSIYYLNTETNDWTLLDISTTCVSPLCDEPCDKIQMVCDQIPHPAFCEASSGQATFEWNKEHMVEDIRTCNNKIESCFKSVPAETGEYKIVYSYKTDPCPVIEIQEGYKTEKGVFQNNIKTIEKTFTLYNKINPDTETED